MRIIVSEPLEWSYENLFGRIVFDRRKEKIIIKLTKPIKGSKLIGDLLELKPLNQKETFKPLIQNYSVTVSGTLIDETSNVDDYKLIGSVTFD